MEKIKLVKEIETSKINEELKDKIRIKDEYLQLIIDLGYDYDGYEKSESLKALIDELVSLASKALKNDTKAVVYQSVSGTKYNILHEVIESEEIK